MNDFIEIATVIALIVNTLALLFVIYQTWLAKHEESFTYDPVGFIEGAYSECILSNRIKTKMVIEKVFGQEHPFVEEFSRKEQGQTLYSLRNNLAHGSFTLADPEHRDIVEKRIASLARLAYAFILRVATQTPPNKKLHQFTRFSLSIITADPRSTGVTNNLDMIPNKDWRIRLEWLF